MTRNLLLAAVAALALSTSVAHAAPSKDVVAAVADAGRPEADTKRDADRKPAEMLEFAGVKPGQTVADFLPGGGYFTRIFSKAVGPKGTVYAVINAPPPNPAPDAKPNPILAVAADANYGNVKVVQASFQTLALPTQADVIWTSQNYHDLHLARFNLDVAAVNKAVYAALKPGGVYIVLDHAALLGAPLDTADKLHRIDPAIVKSELAAAGFQYEGESTLLRNTTDDHTKGVFDPTLRGHTDQFIYKFRKPK
ncbi:methyltransferase [Phenylobacterium sp.]|uniref:class I SAM-dependent methyltransferase n=1 Tax=Phenylobacterium sp. TaxID=1871053 RepID=UPI0030F44CF7